jgi:hypothetical protein
MLTKTVQEIAEVAHKKALITLSEMKKGNDVSLEWGDDLVDGKVTLKEMIGTDSGAEEFLEKVNLEAFQEMAKPEYQVLYTPIYDVIEDATLPKILTIEEMGPFGIVFLEYLEGSEIKFGTLEPGQEKIVRMKTMAAGLEYTEDMVEYNEFFRVSEQARQMGRTWVATQNYLTLSPIFLGSYVTSGADLQDQKEYQEGAGGLTATAQLIEWDTSINQTLRNAITVLPSAKYILCSSADVMLLEDALAGALLPNLQKSRVGRQLLPENIIVWDGFKSVVGAKTYDYAGVEAGEIFLVSGAKLNFKYYIKHPLRIESGDGDLSRLIVAQVVARARGGLYAAIAGQEGAVKVEIYEPED